MKVSRGMLASVLILLTAGAAGGARDEGGGADKPSTFGNASLQLPKGWVVIEAGSNRFRAKASQADRDGSGPGREGEFSANVTIKVTPAAGEVDVGTQLKNIESSMTNYRRVEEPSEMTVGGAKGITFGGTFVLMAGKVPVRTRLYLVTINGKLYVIAFSTLASRWGEYAGPIEASVKTFAVKGG